MSDSSTPLNPLYDPSTNDLPIADATQLMLNTPLAGGTLGPEDEAFLHMLLGLVEDGTLNLYAPGTLRNDAVYETLSPEAKVSAERHSHSMMAKIRDIIQLQNAPMDTNYQVQNLVRSLRLNKEQMEAYSGDIFII